MMPRYFVACLIGLSFILSGCGSLRVKVDVLDSAVPESELDRLVLRESLPVVLAQSDVALRGRFADLQNAHFELINKLAAEYRSEAARLTGRTQQGLLAIAQGVVSPLMWKFMAQLPVVVIQ